MRIDYKLYVTYFRATNEHETKTDEVEITVEKAEEVKQCIDNPNFANCHIIVRAKYCTRNAYYADFCCASCTEAGQLGPEGYVPPPTTTTPPPPVEEIVEEETETEGSAEGEEVTEEEVTEEVNEEVTEESEDETSGDYATEETEPTE